MVKENIVNKPRLFKNLTAWKSEKQSQESRFCKVFFVVVEKADFEVS